jgi:putative SOS response-associated peptidase YedK
MCGRYVSIQRIEAIEKIFDVQAPGDMEQSQSYNISPGQKAAVITNDKPKELQLFSFGFTPFWADKPTYWFNARSEGDKNKDNDPNYKGSRAITEKPAFRKAIRSQRCLVVADCFIEGTTKEKLSKPYVVYLKNRRPFAFAGIWDTWINKETGELLNSFAIITTTANTLLQKLPHHRSPVILNKEDENTWLDNETPVEEVTGLLTPYPSDLMNAYPISADIKNPRAEGLELMTPMAQRVTKEFDYTIYEEMKFGS